AGPARDRQRAAVPGEATSMPAPASDERGRAVRAGIVREVGTRTPCIKRGTPYLRA
ncbi:hypothetical protein HPB47_019903, partial [Ixodes persulcatus]